ncbi:hypothetical protein HmCmsJML099_01013 [Escherichia coli]|nr:hypothetical protein HmCmsJML099_01013 [Escherichia coli]
MFPPLFSSGASYWYERQAGWETRKSKRGKRKKKRKERRKGEGREEGKEEKKGKEGEKEEKIIISLFSAPARRITGQGDGTTYSVINS